MNIKYNFVEIYKIKLINYKKSNKTSKLLRVLIAISFTAFILPNTVFATGTNSSATTSNGFIDRADDQILEHKVNQILSDKFPKRSFTVASYGHSVLLAGRVATYKDKVEATTAVTNVMGVGKVWNYLSIGANEKASEIANDAYLTTAAKSRLIAQKDVNTYNIKVVTSSRVVYLLGDDAGQVKQIEAAIAGIKGINNVRKVVNLIGQ
ncbi:MAG: BON domain-containing protein [Burkholderiales bacterium]|nr:BON domain-containing protein [Burkholderiales bacterium]